MQGVCTPPPSWDAAFFYISEFKIGLPHQSVAPFLSGAPSAKKNSGSPLLPFLAVSLVAFFPLSSLIVFYLPGKRRCVLSVVILNTPKKVLSSIAMVKANLVMTISRPLSQVRRFSLTMFRPSLWAFFFFKSLTVGVEGDFGDQRLVSLEVLHS